MISSLIGDADRKPVGAAHARELSKVSQVLGCGGNFIFAALPSELRQFYNACSELGIDPSETLLDAVQVAMEATIATAAQSNGRAA